MTEYDFVIFTMNAVVTFSTNHPVEDNFIQYTVYIMVQTLVAAPGPLRLVIIYFYLGLSV